jgi:hypothetical protein
MLNLSHAGIRENEKVDALAEESLFLSQPVDLTKPSISKLASSEWKSD